MTATIYLLHFNQPYHHARHYLGYTDDLVARLLDHGTEKGARLTQVVADNGITWALARTWTGDGVTRTFERQLKKRHNTPRLCPICDPDGAMARGGII